MGARLSETEYSLIEGLPDEEMFGAIVQLSNTTFGFDEEVAGYKVALSNRRRLLFCLAFEDHTLVGFKVGYEERSRYFESWRGGVLPNARGKGIAGRLMELQHAWCVEQGFSFITTNCNNQSIDMLRLNLAHGLLVTGSYLDRGEHLKLLLQKDIRPPGD
jgi:predicted GNAT superfamily acetyltransferase